MAIPKCAVRFVVIGPAMVLGLLKSRLALVLLFVSAAAPLCAQMDELAEIGDVTPRNLALYFLLIGSVGLLLLIIFFMLKRRFGSREKFDLAIGLNVDDVTSLQKKGLLTPEESQKVRQALARQLTRQLENQPKRTVTGGVSSLLVDPDVLRLQEAARRKAELAAAEDRTAAQLREEIASSEVPPDEQPSARRKTEAAAAQAEATAEDDVQLPHDVLQMAELGLITPDELERIKERIRSKKSQSDNG